MRPPKKKEKKEKRTACRLLLLLASLLLRFLFLYVRFFCLSLHWGNESGLFQEIVEAGDRRWPADWTCSKSRCVQLLFQECDLDSGLSRGKYLIVRLGLPHRVSWPETLGLAPLQRFWSVGLFCNRTGFSQSEGHDRLCDEYRDGSYYGVVAMGLGGWSSGEQSSVGEGRPSESSLSRWTCGTDSSGLCNKA